jgi:pimeloyl-ACP methyl ester carboxylesterase
VAVSAAPGRRTATVAGVARQHWPAAGPARGRVLLLHGLSSIADSWWRMGPALAREGWDVTAVDQAGHGGRPLAGEADHGALAAAIRAVHPDGPDALLGHSLGVLTVLALLEHDPGWAPTVILEDPPSVFDADACLALADGIVADVAAVRADHAAVVARVRGEQPAWADEDVHWAVQGIAEMDPEPFARLLRAVAHDERLRRPTPDRVLAAAPAAHVLAARSRRPFLDGGSALSDADREALARRLPAGHVVDIRGGHCLHRDAPHEWLAAVRAILG